VAFFTAEYAKAAEQEMEEKDKLDDSAFSASLAVNNNSRNL
jgi:hypothetical protein